MYTLYVERVIQSCHCNVNVDKFDSLDRALDCLYSSFWLSAHCVDDNGIVYQVSEQEYFDEELGQDCVRLDWSTI